MCAFSAVSVPKCFQSLARMNDDPTSEFRFLDPTSPNPQCVCSAVDSVPCTVAEVYESRKFWSPLVPKFACPEQASAGAEFQADRAGSADSKSYFAASDLGKVFCPMSHSATLKPDNTSVTFSRFASAAEMNEYCEKGSDFLSDLAMNMICKFVT